MATAQATVVAALAARPQAKAPATLANSLQPHAQATAPATLANSLQPHAQATAPAMLAAGGRSQNTHRREPSPQRAARSCHLLVVLAQAFAARSSALSGTFENTSNLRRRTLFANACAAAWRRMIEQRNVLRAIQDPAASIRGSGAASLVLCVTSWAHPENIGMTTDPDQVLVPVNNPEFASSAHFLDSTRKPVPTYEITRRFQVQGCGNGP